MLQGRYDLAIAQYAAARTLFEQQNEPQSVAVAWHQTGMVYQEAGQFEAAETAYRRSLEIATHSNSRFQQASSLGELGILYSDYLKRPEEAVIFFQQAADIHVEQRDLRHEGVARNNIANVLSALQRYDEARREIQRAIECKQHLWCCRNNLDLLRHPAPNRNRHGQPCSGTGGVAAGPRCLSGLSAAGGYAQYGGGKLVEEVLSLLAQQQIDEVQSPV
jgi:tetratricopeptide (TPR) repeat protein